MPYEVKAFGPLWVVRHTDGEFASAPLPRPAAVALCARLNAGDAVAGANPALGAAVLAGMGCGGAVATGVLGGAVAAVGWWTFRLLTW